MEGITGFLQKYLNFNPPARAAQRAVCAAFVEVLHTELQEKQVRVANGVAYVDISGAEKSEMLLRKAELLEALRAKGIATVRDVK